MAVQNNSLDKGYIDKRKKGSSAFEQLYREGIELLQTFSSDVWTDYNQHDPGITILENLSYALTELSFKTGQPIADILRESKGSPLVSGDNALFVASDILTSSPVTIMDYRKILIDGVKNVKNVLIEPTTNSEDRGKPLSGIYTIYVESYDYDFDADGLIQEEKRIQEEISSLFHKNRNLCENLSEVVWCRPLYLDISLKLSLDKVSNGELVFAQAFYNVNDYLTHDVVFRSLQELLLMGYDTNTIYDGPRLENGYILDVELREKHDHLLPSQILKVISRLDGVHGVDFFKLHTLEENNGEVPERVYVSNNGVYVPKNRFLRLKVPENNAFLRFMHDGVQFSPNMSEVSKQISYLEAMSYGQFKSVSSAHNDLEIPAGDETGLSSYYAIRNQFPSIYGVGEFGLGTNLPPERYAKANQLKAYLMAFDQVMANHLAQLTHLYTLYDVHNGSDQSYFFQVLNDMNEMVQLVRISEVEEDNVVLSEWEHTLDELNEAFDSKADERHLDIANHLLARFGETYPSYALKKINRSSYGSTANEWDFDKKLLKYQRKLLKEYGELSYARARSVDHTKSQVDKPVPALLRKIALEFGISNTDPVCVALEEAGIRIYKRDRQPPELAENLTEINAQRGEQLTPSTELVLFDEDAMGLSDSFFFFGHGEHVLKDILRHGVSPVHYDIKHAKNENEKQHYVRFKHPENSKTYVVHITESEHDARKAITYATKLLEHVNKKSEALYMLEHNLLIPPLNSRHFGYCFLLDGDKDEIRFNEPKVLNFNERNLYIQNICQGFDNQSVRTSIVEFDRSFVVQVLSERNQVIAVTAEACYSLEEAQRFKERIDAICGSNTSGGIKEISCQVVYETERIDETELSYKITFVMPNWSGRFQDTNFRTKLTNSVYREAPIYAVSQCVWLDFNHMKKFEETYFQWLELQTNNELEEARIKLSYDLLQLIR